MFHSIHIAHLFKMFIRLISSFFVCCALAVCVCCCFFFYYSSLFYLWKTFTVQKHYRTAYDTFIFERMRDGVAKKKWMSYFPFLLALSSNRSPVLYKTIKLECIMWPKTIDSFTSLPNVTKMQGRKKNRL